MINIYGETKLHFKTDKITTNLIHNRLNHTFERYCIISHRISNYDHLLHIKFNMYMQEKKNNKQLSNYSKYARNKFNSHFPMIIKAYDFIVHEISYSKTIEPITHNKNFMVTYFNNPHDTN